MSDAATIRPWLFMQLLVPFDLTQHVCAGGRNVVGVDGVIITITAR